MRSLRGRVTALVTLVVAAAFLLTGLVIVGATSRAQTQRLERQLGERMQLLLDADGRRPLPADRVLGPGFFLLVRDRLGGVRNRFGEQPRDEPPPSGDRIEEFRDSDGTRYLVTSRRTRQGSLQIGANVDEIVGRDVRALRNRFLLLGGIATVLTALATGAVVSVASRPLRRLRDATQRVAATEDLATRVDSRAAPSEIADVAEGLNTMLSRLEHSATAREAALQAARRFAADAGHELRTPLTAMQTSLDALERNPDVAPHLREAAIAEVAAETRRLTHLLSSLQALARADAAAGGTLEQVDIGEVILDAVESARARHPSITWTAQVPDNGGHVVKGSEPWLRSIVDNLLANAAVHGRPEGRVDATLTPLGQWLGLTVDDDGPGIPPKDRTRVFERFTRGADTTGREGAGLGLALVAQLTALHGGQVSVVDSPLGGTRIEVILPRGAVSTGQGP